MSTARTYLVVSPVRDEEAFLQRTIDTVLAQRERPTRWVIVDDGSRDATPRIAAEAAARHDWITVVSRPARTTRVLGAGVVHAFNAGLRAVDLDDYAYVSKLDADLELPAGYFAALMDLMEADPRLATASGRPYVGPAWGRLVPERAAAEMSAGMAKFYRVSAFRDIGGLVPEIMWDGIDAHESRVHGWRSGSFDGSDLAFWHLRPEGGSDRGVLRGRRRHGFGQWFMGTDPVFMAASAALRMRDEPAVVGSLTMLAGYVGAALRGVPRHGSPAFRRQLRRFQRESLVLGKARATARWERHTARRWPGTPQGEAVAVLTSELPALSHGFIEREILSLREAGWLVRPVSARPGSTSSGVGEVTVLQARGAVRMLMDVLRVAMEPSSAVAGLTAALRPAGHPGLRPVGLAYLVQAAGLRSVLRRAGIRHVHVHFANNAAEIARIAVDMDRAATYPEGLTWSLTIHGLWMHGMTGDPATDDWPRRQERRWGSLREKLACADKVVAVSEEAARHLRDLTARPDVEVVHLGVDTRRFVPRGGRVSIDPGSTDRPFTAVFVGRFAPEKDLATMLRAWARVRDTLPGARLVLVGSGPQEARLRGLAADLGLEGALEWTGPLGQDDLPAFYQRCDVGVLTSRNEGIPVFLMEAMACGLPVVASRVGGIPVLVADGETGRLLPPGDPAAFADALLELARDPDRRAAYGRRARERVCRDFDTRTQAAVLARILSRVVSPRRPRASSAP